MLNLKTKTEIKIECDVIPNEKKNQFQNTNLARPARVNSCLMTFYQHSRQRLAKRISITQQIQFGDTCVHMGACVRMNVSVTRDSPTTVRPIKRSVEYSKKFVKRI